MTGLSLTLVPSDSADSLKREKISFGFSSDEDHPIDELLNRRSWMRDDVSQASTEDDELEHEMKMLSLAEYEVSQELRDLMMSYRKHSGARYDSNRDEENPTFSPLNVISSEVVEQKGKGKISQQNINGRSKRKIHANISNIYQVEIDMIERDARESPDESQPSDEACNGINAICNRDPPENILFVDSGECLDDNGSSSGLEEMVHHMTTSVTEDVNSIEESISINSLDESSATNESAFDQLGKKENACDTLYEWDVRSRQLFDIEKGESNLFEEEMFWEESFWKTTLHESQSRKKMQNDDESFWKTKSQESPPRNISIQMQNDEESFWKTTSQESLSRKISIQIQNDDETRNEVCEKSKTSSMPQSRRPIVELLSLPTLQHRVEKGRELQPVVLVPEQVIDDSVPSSLESLPRTNIENSELIERGEVQSIDHSFEEMPSNRLFVPNSTIPVVGDDTLTKNTSRCWDIRGNVRKIVLAIHITLVAIGVIVFCFFYFPQGT